LLYGSQKQPSEELQEFDKEILKLEVDYGRICIGMGSKERGVVALQRRQVLEAAPGW
jgi:hypothetical protein